MSHPLEPISRRRWAAHTLVSAAAGVVAASAQAVKPAAEVRWKVGIGLNGFESGERKHGKRYPLWEILAFAADGGFDGVELVSNWPQGGYPASTDRRAVEAL